ncbi:hypothetical protein B0I32_106300 [Nonomuraea fuscirosea]|uniref:Uncharacterized protein n=1 Tax=Nonomuraea fuscirosea TaxID=1291556 RepID=A0A2T0N2F9_9ACTN|nr:hypothetical protein [Nonomuraea fuscirosea]PRX66164.1 hypothetical protein B0I32_106300 [Nonomuraea fuscirosea]
MPSTTRALITSASAAILGWIAAGVTTCWVVLNPTMHYVPVSLLWLHSAALVATISTLLLVALRAFNRMIGETKQAYALGLEHGISIMGAFESDLSGPAEQPAPRMPEAPAAAGASG